MIASKPDMIKTWHVYIKKDNRYIGSPKAKTAQEACEIIADYGWAVIQDLRAEE